MHLCVAVFGEVHTMLLKERLCVSPRALRWVARVMGDWVFGEAKMRAVTTMRNGDEGKDSRIGDDMVIVRPIFTLGVGDLCDGGLSV